MPELPEVETVRRGLSAALEGALIVKVAAHRPDLRIPLPKGFAGRLEGARIGALTRRGKYLIASLSTGESLISHLGMTGRFSIIKAARKGPGDFYYGAPPDPAHDHVVFELEKDRGRLFLVYNDPRRFGLMDLAATAGLETCRHFAGMGPEPLDAAFTADAFDGALSRRAAPIKAALLDQRVVAGLGNIYACEALHRAGLSPKRTARSCAGARAIRLRIAVIEVLSAAIEAGGSTLRDFAAADGAKGRFQQGFRVYDRAGAPCPACGAPVRRIVQSGRSTFYCGPCQR